jgi:murein DD-endopeptidase MepM/ murein hydrolase activator NlpD
MRAALLILALVATLATGAADAQTSRLQWPLRPAPVVLRPFDAPRPNWTAGHRGVDLAGADGQAVLAAAPARVVYAGTLAGSPLVSLEHPGGLRTTYQPVRPLVRAGQQVDGGAPIGTLLPGHAGCGAPACLHWGAMWGPSARADYIDPRDLLISTRVRLKPTR